MMSLCSVMSIGPAVRLDVDRAPKLGRYRDRMVTRCPGTGA